MDGRPDRSAARSVSARGRRSAGASSATRPGRSCGPCCPAWSSRSCWPSLYLGLRPGARARGADLPGGDLRVLALAVYAAAGARRRHRRDLPRRAAADRLRDGPPTERLERRARLLRGRADRLAGDGRRRSRSSGRCSAEPRRASADAPMATRTTQIALVHPYHSAVRCRWHIIRRCLPGIQGDHRTHPFEVSACPSTSSTSRCPKLYGARPTPARRGVARRSRGRSIRTTCRSRPSRPRRSASFAATLPARAWAPGGGTLDGRRGDGRRNDAPRSLTGRHAEPSLDRRQAARRLTPAASDRSRPLRV